MGVGRYEKWAPYTVNSQTLTADDHFVNFVSPGTDFADSGFADSFAS